MRPERVAAKVEAGFASATPTNEELVRGPDSLGTQNKFKLEPVAIRIKRRGASGMKQAAFPLARLRVIQISRYAVWCSQVGFPAMAWPMFIFWRMAQSASVTATLTAGLLLSRKRNAFTGACPRTGNREKTFSNRRRAPAGLATHCICGSQKLPLSLEARSYRLRE
jgi:hypothetical protein